MIISGMDQSLPKRLARPLGISLSCHWWYLVTPRIALTLVEGVETHLTCSAFRIQVSALYNNTRQYNRPVLHSFCHQWENRVVEDRTSQAAKGSGSLRYAAIHMLHEIPIFQQVEPRYAKWATISISPPLHLERRPLCCPFWANCATLAIVHNSHLLLLLNLL